MGARFISKGDLEVLACLSDNFILQVNQIQLISGCLDDVQENTLTGRGIPQTSLEVGLAECSTPVAL